jgi:hypothetical protein
MDDQQFDAFTRMIVLDGSSRRAALRSLTGGALGAALAGLAPRPAAAKKCKKKRDCGSGELCCDGTCSDTDGDPDHCGKCGKECKGGEKCCRGDCVDTKQDDKNCGKCGKKCKDGKSCQNGKCEGEDNCLLSGAICLGGPNDDIPCCPPSFCKNLGGTGLCCRPDGQTCSSDVECCSDLCEDNLCVDCLPLGAGCDSDGQCCSDECFDGECVPD